MICGSKKWGCRPEMEKQWTGETENGSEKNEIGVRNVFRKLTVSVDRIGAWIGADRSVGRNSLGVDRSLFRFRCGVDRSLARERIGAGFEWIEVMFVECVELGS